MKVYAAINAVQAALAETGIAKDRTNTQGSGYKFRGIDDVYKAIAPLLAKHSLCIVPRFVSRTCDERQSKNGGALFYVTVEAEFDFISSEDGSKHTARTFGEAMDSGDKATNKAMSAAYKYAAFQTFAIPTEGNPDADAETHEVASVRLAQRAEWMETTAMQLEGCETADELKTAWSAAVKVTKAEQDTDAYDTLKPVMERMAALIKEQSAVKA